MKKENPDLIISGNLMGLSFMLPVLFGKLKIKHLHILHDIQLLYPSGLMFFGQEKILESVYAKLYQKINISLFKNVKYLISPSGWLLDEHIKRGFFKTAHREVVLNPIARKRRDINFERKKMFTFLFVGHLSKAKGVNVLIRAYQKLKSELTEDSIDLILAGNDSLDKSMRRVAVSLGVKILGFVDNKKIESLILSSDFLVAPSLCYENSPTVIYEAVRCGLPFVTVDLGGAKELAKEFNGQIFKPGDYVLLKDIMASAIKKTSLKDDFIKNNQEKIEIFSIENYIKRLLKTVA